MRPLGPSPPPALPDTCVMSVFTGDPQGRPWPAPATQAVNHTGDGVQDAWKLEGWGTCLCPPHPKLSPGILGQQRWPPIHTESQTSGPYHSPRWAQQRKEKHLSTYCMPTWCQELALSLPTSDIISSTHLSPDCFHLFPPFEHRHGEHLLSTYCIPDSMLVTCHVLAYRSLQQPCEVSAIIIPFYR